MSSATVTRYKRDILAADKKQLFDAISLLNSSFTCYWIKTIMDITLDNNQKYYCYNGFLLIPIFFLGGSRQS